MIEVVLAPNAELAMSVNADVTIEAEYGSVVAKGRVYTAAHHQVGMEHDPAPCNDEKIPLLNNGTILLSHVDPDSIGGALRALGPDYTGGAVLFSEGFQSFWDLVEFVDKNGSHRIERTWSGADEKDILRFHALRAWLQTNKPDVSWDKVTDVTEYIRKAGEHIARVLEGDEEALEAGVRIVADDAARNVRTFERVQGRVIVRVYDSNTLFCNDLYNTPDGTAFDAVAAYNKEKGTVTISLSMPVDGVNCRDLVQGLWGEEAGGHPGIAGSPRGHFLTYHEFQNAVTALISALL